VAAGAGDTAKWQGCCRPSDVVVGVSGGGWCKRQRRKTTDGDGCRYGGMRGSQWRWSHASVSQAQFEKKLKSEGTEEESRMLK
jgi:hypothetical protein